jgi:pimeloyl-ACP methyl ester carboxylesterase
VNATYVFVHGSNSNSFGWAGVQRELALLGRRTLAIDLPDNPSGSAPQAPLRTVAWLRGFRVRTRHRRT